MAAVVAAVLPEQAAEFHFRLGGLAVLDGEPRHEPVVLVGELLPFLVMPSFIKMDFGIGMA